MEMDTDTSNGFPDIEEWEIQHKEELTGKTDKEIEVLYDNDMDSYYHALDIAGIS